ncbi:deoxyribodipyrimidine photo-lyase [Roseibium sp. RKSG952]|uniref:cryptochrome/photolyase family protein n=1 Tax=Roseibium sp. RKSG952 TaxID=2529384 RepID=UPI0012BD6986|nr:deoxyribodipyrimidine photo-lyase [Roseibium sp. RKSG952]MTH95585.1 deoxyribodipyrimidine photo-lyase [Roseibium sp. RKSG952]
MSTIVWFRQDLRLSDNPAFSAAVESGAVLPVFIAEDDVGRSAARPLGGTSKWWLHHSLSSLSRDLGGLSLYRGDPETILMDLVEKFGIKRVVWNRSYDPHAVKRDTTIKSALKNAGIEVQSFKASLLFEPWELETKSGGPFKVYSPFWRAAKAKGVDVPVKRPVEVEIVRDDAALSLVDLELLPMKPDWAAGWERLWSPGEEGALARLEAFFETGLSGYGDKRNRPDMPNVSRLSPHLRFGEISPRQVWAATQHLVDRDPSLAKDGDKFLSELVWREFSYHLLYHFPKLVDENWRPAFNSYPWRDSDSDLSAWQRGLTGYPIVDAGMRELWHTGYMHNRVRMVVASFLVKHLRMHWRKGEDWFWDTLVDADIANNAASWQWVTGSGADAAPYFRIFNPITQGEKFDPEGTYIRQWVPELKDLETAYLFAPFDAPEKALQKAGIRLGETYPEPIVDHASARQAALDGYEKVKQAAA